MNGILWKVYLLTQYRMVEWECITQVVNMKNYVQFPYLDPIYINSIPAVDSMTIVTILFYLHEASEDFFFSACLCSIYIWNDVFGILFCILYNSFDNVISSVSIMFYFSSNYSLKWCAIQFHIPTQFKRTKKKVVLFISFAFACNAHCFGYDLVCKWFYVAMCASTLIYNKYTKSSSEQETNKTNDHQSYHNVQQIQIA